MPTHSYMKRYLTDSLMVISSLITLILLAFSGCIQQETPKKVSLYERPGKASTVTESPHHHQSTLWFGFDLMLGPKEEVRIYIPFLKYLEKITGTRFRIKFTEKYEETVENLGKGRTHFAAIGTLNYVIGKDKYGVKYLVSGVNQEGDPIYRTVIFTRPESSIKNLEDLKGKCFAFGSGMSAHGHLIPRKMIEDAGVTVKDLSKYIYTGSHVNTVKSVLNGDCDAGGIQDTLARRLELEQKIKILKISEPYPGSVIAYNSDMDSEIVEKIKSALLAFDPTGKHKDILVDWDKTDMPLGFTEINEPEFNKITTFAREYGLLPK